MKKTKHTTHPAAYLFGTFFSISRQARPLRTVKSVYRFRGNDITEIKHYPDGWEPGFHIEGSLVPACPFCGVRAILVVVLAKEMDERQGYLDRFTKKLSRRNFEHDDVLIECSNWDCRAGTNLLDYIGVEGFVDVLGVLAEDAL